MIIQNSEEVRLGTEMGRNGERETWKGARTRRCRLPPLVPVSKLEFRDPQNGSLSPEKSSSVSRLCSNLSAPKDKRSTSSSLVAKTRFFAGPITREWRFLFEWAIDSKLARLGGGVGSTY